MSFWRNYRFLLLFSFLVELIVPESKCTVQFHLFQVVRGVLHQPSEWRTAHTRVRRHPPVPIHSFFSSWSIRCRLLSQMSPDTDLWADPELLFFKKADTQECQSWKKCHNRGTTCWAQFRMSFKLKPGCLLELCSRAVFQNVFEALVVNEEHFKSVQKVVLSQKLVFHPVDSARCMTGIDVYRYVGFVLGWFGSIYIFNPEEFIPIIHCG